MDTKTVKLQQRPEVPPEQLESSQPAAEMSSDAKNMSAMDTQRSKERARPPVLQVQQDGTIRLAPQKKRRRKAAGRRQGTVPASARGEDNQVEKLRHVLHSARIEHPTGAEIPRRVRPDSPGEYLAKNYDDTYAERFAVEFAVCLKCFAPVQSWTSLSVDKKDLGRLFLSKRAEASTVAMFRRRSSSSSNCRRPQRRLAKSWLRQTTSCRRFRRCPGSDGRRSCRGRWCRGPGGDQRCPPIGMSHSLWLAACSC